MTTIKKAALVLVGILVGCGGAALSPLGASSAQTSGKWACYAAWNLPDVKDAAGDSADVTQGMNAIASNTPAGTVVVVPSSGSGHVCMKN